MWLSLSQCSDYAPGPPWNFKRIWIFEKISFAAPLAPTQQLSKVMYVVVGWISCCLGRDHRRRRCDGMDGRRGPRVGNFVGIWADLCLMEERSRSTSFFVDLFGHVMFFFWGGNSLELMVGCWNLITTSNDEAFVWGNCDVVSWIHGPVVHCIRLSILVNSTRWLPELSYTLQK